MLIRLATDSEANLYVIGHAKQLAWTSRPVDQNGREQGLWAKHVHFWHIQEQGVFRTSRGITMNLIKPNPKEAAVLRIDSPYITASCQYHPELFCFGQFYSGAQTNQ
jgi:hypothetical protein